MNKQDIEYLYRYNRWANSRVLEDAAKLTPEQFVRDLQASHRSVRDTLAHILAAEWIWLERWNGVSPKALLDPADFPSVESVRTRLEKVESECADYIQGLTDQMLGETLTYTNTRNEEWTYTYGQMLQHVANHSSYHRGQVIAMLRQLGAEVRPVDLLVFVDVTDSGSSG
jgi:uncharacterized damage-inducible protein DinB